MTRPGTHGRVRLKYLAHVEMGQSPPSGGYSHLPEEGLPFLQGTADFGPLTPVPLVFCASPTKIAARDDILFSVRAPVGELNVADQELGIGRGLCAIRAGTSWATCFAWWALHEARHQLNYVSTGSTYEAVATEDVANLLVEHTALDEQRGIADFLDHETARLDALVAAKERVLGLLSEKRRALITRAVTRGLDPRAPLRDSGVPWLGKIPANWETWKLGHVAFIGNGSTPNRDNPEYWADGTIPWLNSSVVNQEEVTASEQFVTSTALCECHLPLVKPGSVLLGITGQGKTRGRAVVLSFEATVNQHIAFITPNAECLDSWFLRWALFAAYEFLRSISDDAGGTKGALTCEEIAALRVPLPSIEEQQKIVRDIFSATSKIDALKRATERTIDLLKERRGALIAAAVTGQINIEGAT